MTAGIDYLLISSRSINATVDSAGSSFEACREAERTPCYILFYFAQR